LRHALGPNSNPVAFHGVDSCELKPGDWLAVVGCGGLGQLAIQYGKAMGFKVIGLDINESILSVATQAGADAVFNTLANKNYVEEIRTLTKGGANAAAVFSASQAAYNSATKILQIMGVLMVIGLPREPIQFSALDLMKSLYRIKSESTGPPHKMPRAIEFTSKHNIVPQVSFYKLEQINEMIEKMSSGKAQGRMAVVF
jgi:propanol-preferring alcohol dehydrogenase